MLDLKAKLNIKSEKPKLIADLNHRKNYIISAFALKSYMRAGIELVGT